MAMHYSHRLSSGRLAQIVGTFILIPVLILAVAAFWMAKTEHLFEPTYHVKASLSKSYGLEPGSPVVVSGIPIGRVQQVDLNDRGTVDLTLRLLARYQTMVKDNSELRITKSGVVVGQTQVDIGMGTSGSPMLTDGATIRAVEPRDIGDLVNEIEPVLAAVKQTLLRVETMTQDLQGGLKAGSKALEQVAQATQDLPAVVASVQRTVASVEQTAAALPGMAGSMKRTLGLVDRVTADVQQTASKLPAVLDGAQSTLASVKRLSDSVGEVSQELVPVVQTAQVTLSDLSVLVRGAKQTFPFNRFAQNAGPAPKQPSGVPPSGLPSLRGDQLRR
ncbi:MAG: ABC transporter, substrate-binding protein (cluster 9, phospholipid) [Nitrospira sp.]|jgi:phospholipid/cholesterol/gamma-HCH transport system substrate-binding protein|nr:MAG: ABC transporter, substrate-binding protein (cluster 9, phospholipid) [Nitrospira sp.]